ncbi:MAG: oligosaccharide flippase family protein [bacterium]|nr:MAG: oligosaccharide flippase family protein [bacterium]
MNKDNQQLFEELNQSSTEKSGGIIYRLFQHSAIYSLSTSVQRLQGLIMTPIYTSTLYLPEMSQYGNYGLIYTFIAFMNFVYLFGMDSAFLRYFFLGKSNRKTVFSTIFIILLLSGVVLSVILFAFSNQLARWILFSTNLAPLVKLAGIILFLDSLGNLPFLILRAEEKPVRFSVFRMIRFVFELLLNILFVVILRKGVLGILYANIGAALVNFIIMLPYTIKYLGLRFNRSLLSEMVKFGIPFLPNGIAFMTIEMIDRFLVTKYLGKDVLAYYHANYKFASILLLLIVGFRNAWQPFFLKYAKKSDAPTIYLRVLDYYLFIASILVVGATLFVQDILTYKFFDSFYLLNNSEYWAGIDFIPWIILAYFCYGIYVIFTPGFYIEKKSQYMVVFTGTGALLNILLNLWLLPRIGVWGAVIATVAAYAMMAISIYGVAQKIYPIPVSGKNFLAVFLLIGIFYGIYYIFEPQLVFKIGLFMIYTVLAWQLILTKKTRNAIITYFK